MKKLVCGILILSRTLAADVPIRQITFDGCNHAIGPYNAWSPDDRRIVFTCGPNESNEIVAQVDVLTGKSETLYKINNQTPYGPGCGTASFCDKTGQVVFIHGPRNPTAERQYEFWRRSACMIGSSAPNKPVFLDARDVTVPFTEGALRGGTHCHQFSKDGTAIAFTYNDMLVSPDLRTIGVSRQGKPVQVDANEENHAGAWFSVLLVPVVENPKPGSDELSRAYENCWVEFPDGRRAVAFKGDHLTADGSAVTDLYLVDVPEVLESQGPENPLAGTAFKLPFSPKGAVIHKLTDFSRPGSPKLTRKPRFWLSSAPDGTAVFFLARDHNDVNQVYSIAIRGGAVRQITSGDIDVISTVGVHSSGDRICYVRDGSVFVTRLNSLYTERLTEKERYEPRCAIWSHGDAIVFESRTDEGGVTQLFVITVP